MSLDGLRLLDIEPLLERGVVLVQPMYRGREHFSAYLLDRGFYTSVRDRIDSRTARLLMRRLPPDYEEGFAYRICHRLATKRNGTGLGQPAIHAHKGRKYLTLPRRYVSLTRGLGALDAEHLLVLPEEERFVELEHLASYALQATPEGRGEELFQSVKECLLRGCREQIEKMAAEQTASLRQPLALLLRELRAEGGT